VFAFVSFVFAPFVFTTRGLGGAGVYVLEYHAKCGDGWASAVVSVHASLAGARAKLDTEGYDRGQAMTWTPERTKHLNRWRGTFQGESYAYTIAEVELTN